MPPPANSAEFLDLVRKSGVADDARLKGHLQRLTDQNAIPPEATQLASLLLRDGYLTHFQAEQLLQGKWKRFFIGKYKVLERIGAGGMGQVFLCEHKLMRRRVAVKVLPAAKAAEPASLDRFYREARAVAALDHPNIVRAYDIDQDDNLHFIVMEFVDGTNLQDLIKKLTVLDPLRASHYIYGSSVGLQHAHEMGLVHRDIKPANILIDRSGVVKILDMGLARFFNANEDDQLTRKYDENILGTADYLAPEQAIDSHTVDIRADIYSLGATFYFLLAGRPPFPEGSVAQKLLWHQTREPAAMQSIRPEIPEGLVHIVGRMMAKDVAKRYQTPGEIMADLAPWVQSPIPPPADHEMPQLSLAAQGPGAGPSQSRIGPGSPSIIVGLSSGHPPSGSLATPMPGGTRSDILRTDPNPYPATTPMPQPAAAVSAPVAIQNAANVWDEVTADTQTDAKADTDEPKPGKPGRTAKPGTKKRPVALLLAAVAVLFVFCFSGVGAAMYFLVIAKPVPVPPAPGQGQTWYVSTGASPDPQHTLKTLRGALEQSGPDDGIIILEDTLDEPPIYLPGGSKGGKKNLRIEAGNASKTVTWTPKTIAGRQSTAALLLENVDGVKVSGLVLELAGQVDAGISVLGNCPGLTIENVAVKNPKVSGFRFQQVVGDAARPVKLTKCSVKTEAKIEAGVSFAVFNRYVQVQGNRFEGPGLAGLKIDGSAFECEFRSNRVFRFDHGVSLGGKVSDSADFSLVVAENTFHTLAAVGVASELPLKGPKQKLELTRNYFAATAAIASGPAGFPGLKPIDNARDAGSKEGPTATRAIQIDNYAIPANASNDAEFLFPAGSSPLQSVGPTKVAVGARP